MAKNIKILENLTETFVSASTLVGSFSIVKKEDNIYKLFLKCCIKVIR